MTRKINEAEMGQLPSLPVHLPDSGKHSVPFSLSSHELYQPGELRCEDGIQTLRTDEFMKRLVAIYWLNDEKPVPYVFKTADDSVRSMDAGCLGMLHHHREHLVEFELDHDGYIRSVVPQPTLIAKCEPMKQRLIDAITA